LTGILENIKHFTMASTIFNLAKKHFTEQSIKDDFLEALKEKGYIKGNAQ